VGEALRQSYARTGAAVLASGLTAIAGFATLIVTAIPGLGDYDFPMLRDFGFVTVVDLGVALLGVMLVLPAVLVWAEAGFEVPRLPTLPRSGKRKSSMARTQGAGIAALFRRLRTSRFALAPRLRRSGEDLRQPERGGRWWTRH
jgi:predicted exporter